MYDKKKLFWALLFPILAALSVWAVLRSSDGITIPEIVQSLKDASPLWTLAAFLCVAGYILFEGAALGVLLRSSGIRSRFRDDTFYSASDIYFSAITPSSSGGQPAAAYFMIRNGIPAGVATVTLIINVVMYTFATVVVGIVAIFINRELFMGFSTVSKVLIVLGFIMYTGFAVFFYLCLRKGRKIFDALEKLVEFMHRKKLIKNLESKINKIDKARRDYEECVSIMSGKAAGLIKAFIFNILQRVSQLMVPAFLWTALGATAGSIPNIFASQCLITIGYNCVPIPGAMGVADYITIDGFTNLIGYDDAIRLELLSRGISFYLCVIICGLITIIGALALKHRNKVR